MGKFLVKFPCKPYVRRFLEINYGDIDNLNNNKSVDISKDKALYSEFQQKLKLNKSLRYDIRYSNLALDRYSEEINIKISQDDFYRYGWELSKTDIVYLNSLFESRCKLLMYTVVGSHVAIGLTLSSSIDYFQDKYLFPEDVWPKESIYKDCQRNLDLTKNFISHNISEFIDKIMLVKLSANRTISHKARKVYESNNI
ncbi:hypothetical protein M2132_001799 [Dysgonomonas sp. PH5-45]|nr:hypothetical protein [Dysgonomonas sp. PH5-45]MDH6388352.1 hypothetical protein [Dysgonomonas sp. PH5-37]